jgi:quinol monooxygenase YgiN
MAVVIAPETDQTLEERGIERLFLEYPSTLAVVRTYRVRPGCGDVFLEICKKIAAEALRTPECRSFRVLRDRHDPLSHSMVMDWESTAAYVEFERKLRLHHVERVMSRVFHLTRSEVFDVAWPVTDRRIEN